MANRTAGYALIMLLFIVTAMGIGLLVAVPVWQTQIQREREEELIFRGKQYVEAVRIFQSKKPGTFPKTIKELVEERCLRRPFRDPMNPQGDWNIILLPEGGPGGSRGGAIRRGPDRTPEQMRGRPAGRGEGPDQSLSVQSVLVAPMSALSSIRNAKILGVVSSSKQKSIRIYNDEESYDKWLFFYGQDSKQSPEIVYYGQSDK